MFPYVFFRNILRSCFSSSIPKHVYTLNFSRDGNTLDSLNKLYGKLVRARSERGILIASPESIKSVFLTYLDLKNFAACSVLKGDHEAKLKRKMSYVLASILRIFSVKQMGIGLIDEVDLSLHPLKSELNYPIYEKVPLDLGSLRWELVFFMLDGCIFYPQQGRLSLSNFYPDEQGRSVLHNLESVVKAGIASHAIQSVPHYTLLQLDYYQCHILPIAAKWAMIFLMAHPSVALSGIAKSDHIMEALYIYISNQDGSEVKRVQPILNAFFLSDITGGPTGQVVKLINLSRDWLLNLLPHCWKKINSVSFGLLPAGETRYRTEPPSRYVIHI